MGVQIINGQVAIERRVLFDNVNLTIGSGKFYRIHGKNGIDQYNVGVAST